MRSYKKFTISIIILGAVLAAPFLTGKVIVNITPSVPRGLWLITDGVITYGDVVQVPLDAFKSTEWIPEVYRKKTSWGNVPYLKRVSGLPGDVIELSPEGLLLVGGVIIPDSAVLSRDGAGNKLERFPLPVTIASDEVWLMSDTARGFDSRYLGPARLNQCRKVINIISCN